jgi:phosphoserine phosphatase
MNPNSVRPNLSAPTADFVNSVVRLQPRVAAFDCDGTLWAGDAGEGFFDWELAQNLLSDEIALWARPSYAAYKAGGVSEEQMCGEMVTMHRGLTEAEVQRAAIRYSEEHCVRDIFPEMRDLVRRLREAGCDVWAVSSTNEWVIKAAMPHFAIPEEKILAAAARIVDGKITDRLLRVPTGEGKSKALHEAIRRAPDAAFGNSIWDMEMLGMARHAFAVNPTAQLEKIAMERRWTVYFPNSVRAANQK